MADKISQKLKDFIIYKEVTSPSYYEYKYRRPIWPGGASGITVGVGYDLGHQTPATIEGDWLPYVDRQMLNAMKACSKKTGPAAVPLLAQARSQIYIPWSVAKQVFDEVSMPKWTADVKRHLPNTDKLTEDQLGVLVSLSYNRGIYGWDLGHDKFKEMREIKAALRSEDFDAVPNLISAMVRLWPKSEGLMQRRLEEAALWKNQYDS